MITGLYVAAFALVQAAMVVWVAKSRYRHHVSLGDGEVEPLVRKTRVYGNFVETVPVAILLMLIAELGGAPLWTIHWMGGLMVVSRISHAIGLLTGPGYGPFRAAGMLMTIAMFLIGAALCISLAMPHLF